MKRYCYDLHIHSCLSPCADNDNTPNSIAGMAAISGINIIALTDHNTAKNCPAFFEAAYRYGVIPIAGIELTTSEDIHIVCLFEMLDSALEFDAFLQKKRVFIKNRVDIFGEQLIMDSEDNLLGTENFLLSNATSLSIDEIPELVKEYGGICYPAHIDRDANSITAILGTIPTHPKFNCFEIHDPKKAKDYIERYGLHDKHIIISSDAHYLTDIDENQNFFELDCTNVSSPDEVRHRLFELLS